jgi:hypothetical protein
LRPKKYLSILVFSSEQQIDKDVLGRSFLAGLMSSESDP